MLAGVFELEAGAAAQGLGQLQAAQALDQMPSPLGAEELSLTPPQVRLDAQFGAQLQRGAAGQKAGQPGRGVLLHVALTADIEVLLQTQGVAGPHQQILPQIALGLDEGAAPGKIAVVVASAVQTGREGGAGMQLAGLPGAAVVQAQDMGVVEQLAVLAEQAGIARVV